MAGKIFKGVGKILGIGGKNKPAAEVADKQGQGPVVKQLSPSDPLVSRAKSGRGGPFPQVYQSTILEKATRLGARGTLGG